MLTLKKNKVAATFDGKHHDVKERYEGEEVGKAPWERARRMWIHSETNYASVDVIDVGCRGEKKMGR